MPPSKINSLLEQLVAISTDLKSMLAVHDERLNHQEKTTENLETKVEKRREEFDVKLKDVYDTMRDKNNNVFSELNKLRTEATEAHKELNDKLNKLEKFIWMALGGGMVITWLLTNLGNYLRIFH
jgi:predicted RNase H-like nuclease (RuvC/YqgF family)